MKHISLIFLFFFNILLISCQKTTEFAFVKKIELPYSIVINDYDNFITKSFEKKDKYKYSNFSKIIKNENKDISDIIFIGKFIRNKETFIIYQNVTPNESSEFFPNIYLAKINGISKNLCLTPSTEESYIDKITITKDRVILRENYWNSKEEKRKNDRIFFFNFNFDEIKK
ncbi:hypothetical protein ACLB9Y_15010 [Chryseobacterium scophthalmum]|uniref:hypothetical protein n=1 Tax=Chryseobacterium scophthalmum TaxID=59733 RepID=UPI000FA26C13